MGWALSLSLKGRGPGLPGVDRPGPGCSPLPALMQEPREQGGLVQAGTAFAIHASALRPEALGAGDTGHMSQAKP